ncbi:MAG: S1C family serine protease [Actinomycetota bacterium]
MRRLLLPILLLAVVASACTFTVGSRSPSPAALPADTLNTAPIPATSEPVEAVVRRVLPSVVNVTTDIFQQGGSGQGVGTGFIVRSDGVIVTNCHVVELASKITVFTSDADPKQFDARVIGSDCLHDLAVLKIDATGMPTVKLGDSADLVLGQRVVALGYALALEGGPTVTAGIVSALDRTITAQDPNCLTTCGTDRTRTYSNVVQTDAAINHGNSGGPLVNMQGQVVGINSAGDDNAQNIGFAIAIDSVKQTIADAEQNPLGVSAYLGVSTRPVTTDLAFQLGLKVQEGAYVVDTPSDGPAQAAGIRAGDVIVSIDGNKVATADDVGRILENLKAGQKVAVEVIGSDGTRRTIDVTLAARPGPAELP